MSDALPPPYDPAVHTPDDNPTVLLEMYCECGDVRRFVDPVSHVLPQLAGFQAQHAGDGHGPTTAKKSLAEREARRKAGFRMAGRQAEYQPKEHEGEGAGFDWSPPPTS
ncbi:hypothetical protein I4I73_03220 [Pseudonocardia sp. KRD-184]|uniref:Lsr2 protein n=1 Tax=Pseudonocardia oceani TaxID=2792013 RepID=A0ABS6UJZ0_9PSEU|nr:hypothetical protein [Pseudonocardia oceani]MBW0088226.1 hypothetical protein [Pseudonocardia oceani]MBW0095007.1 hypothetical protein [Pseudonocardia oceani]MBW0121139.1 hypothetical protein [Pseudonocardia oceani]MBW0131175.1 hypothetical protein [Pseudonocardia oceani]MBW0132563.1 hypothetical protein [Pseudonocardia oceani]